MLEVTFALKEKAQEAKKNLIRVLQHDCKIYGIRKNEILFSCPEKDIIYRITVEPGLQEGLYFISTGTWEKTEDSEIQETNKFLQRDISYEDLLRILTNPIIWSWTYRSFNRRFSQLLNGLIRLAYTKRETRPIIQPLINKALSKKLTLF